MSRIGLPAFVFQDYNMIINKVATIAVLKNNFAVVAAGFSLRRGKNCYLLSLLPLGGEGQGEGVTKTKLWQRL